MPGSDEVISASVAGYWYISNQTGNGLVIKKKKNDAKAKVSQDCYHLKRWVINLYRKDLARPLHNCLAIFLMQSSRILLDFLCRLNDALRA